MTQATWVVMKDGTIEPYPGTGKIAACSLRGDHHEMMANARLIAAAPELLAAGCTLCAAYDDGDDDAMDSAIAAMRAVIFKAA